SVHHIWCPLSSQEFQDLPDGAETTLTENRSIRIFATSLLVKLSLPIKMIAENMYDSGLVTRLFI
ncbi:hypothetical protein, partial [Klebsiella pneumoniae]|uniref:hypothetical protein n=1 Tax=Klebsiella pneumoniae TaxID=573 RepID=UPI002DB8BE03